MTTLTAERARELFHYDPETGVFTRRITTGNRGKAGSVVGSLSEQVGYLTVKIAGKSVYLHRLAVFYTTGKWPSHEVDHIDGNRVNNKWTNLRDVTTRVNRQNRRAARSDKKQGVLIGTKKHRRKWQARITANGSSHSLGYFDTEDEAHAAYVVAKRRLHEGCTL